MHFTHFSFQIPLWLQDIKKAQREVEAWAKKARKMADDGRTSGNLNAVRMHIMQIVTY